MTINKYNGLIYDPIMGLHPIPSNQSNSRPTPDFPSKDSSANEGDGNQEEDKNHGNGENKNHNGKRGAYDFENVAEEHCQVLVFGFFYLLLHFF